MEYNIPVVDTEVSSEDPDGSVMRVIGAVLGFLTLFGVVGVASAVYTRVRDSLGVEETEVPGI